MSFRQRILFVFLILVTCVDGTDNRPCRGPAVPFSRQREGRDRGKFPPTESRRTGWAGSPGVRSSVDLWSVACRDGTLRTLGDDHPRCWVQLLTGVVSLTGDPVERDDGLFPPRKRRGSETSDARPDVGLRLWGDYGCRTGGMGHREAGVLRKKGSSRDGWGWTFRREQT